MSRAIWKGSIAFGLVNIPVGLTAAEAKSEVRLHMVDSKNQARIRYERVNADTGEEVPWDRIVKGYDLEDGAVVLLTQEDLDAVQPKLNKTIEIHEFVSLEEIDPILFDKPYYLEPEKSGCKAYALLREALRASGKAGISKVVIRTRQYLSAMFVRDEVLILMLLRFPHEIIESSKLDLPLSSDKVWQPTQKEMDLALRLIEEMTGKWQPETYHDDYRESLLDFIERKIAGGEVEREVTSLKENDADRRGGKVLDLAGYLEQSFKMRSLEVDRSATAKRVKETKEKSAMKEASKKTTRKKGRRSA